MDRRDWYASRWRAAAADNGWRITLDHAPFLSLADDRHRLHTMAADVGLDSFVMYTLAGHKSVTTTLLEAACLPSTQSSNRKAKDIKGILRDIEDFGTAVVVKPAVGTGGGNGVTVDPRGTQMTRRAVRDAARHGQRVIVERLVAGRVIRVLVFRGELLDSVHRAPAAVIGDGRASVAALVRRENNRRLQLGPLNTGFLRVDADHLAALHRAGMSSRSVPRKGEAVTVAGRSNTGSEFESRRIEISKSAESVAVAAADAIGVELAGVDLVINEEGEPGAVLEVNTVPGLHWHVLVQGQPFDPFGAILRAIASS